MEISKQQIKNFNDEFKQLKMAGGNVKRTIAEQEVEEGGAWAEGRIPRKILKQIGEEAYKENPQASLTDEDGNTWRLVDKFPTMISYQSPAYRFKYVVGIRGTKLTSFTDIKADVAHLFGKVGKSDRYEKDKEYLLNMIKRHGKHNRFILVGHSLAGAIIKRLANDLMTKNYIEYTLSYNPSFELSDIKKSKKNEADEKIHEVYSENDPLLKIRKVIQPNVEQSPNVEVKKEENKGLLESHGIANPTFEAGGDMPDFFNDYAIVAGGKFKIPAEVKNHPKFIKMKSGVYKNLNMIKWMRDQGDKYEKYLKDAKPEGTMLRWIKEQWANVKEALKGNYKPCGRKTLQTKPYPLCRPMKKISAETPITFPTLVKKGAINKLKEAVRRKEANPDIRISWRKMVKKDGAENKASAESLALLEKLNKQISKKNREEQAIKKKKVIIKKKESVPVAEAPAKKKITVRKKKEPVAEVEEVAEVVNIPKKKIRKSKKAQLEESNTKIEQFFKPVEKKKTAVKKKAEVSAPAPVQKANRKIEEFFKKK
jgi:hypothetical protein